MKSTRQKLFLPLLVSAFFPALTSLAQGTFENLDFDSANIPSGTAAGSFVPASEALPGWNVYVGGSQQTEVLYNSLYTGQSVVALEGPGFAFGTLIPGSTYMPVLQAGTINNQPASAAIAQTGTIPSSTQAILFIGSPPGGWSVSLGGQNLSVVELGADGQNYDYYGANISAFAGLTETLQFTAIAGSGPPPNLALGNIEFSPSAIPEPQTWTLLLCGAGALSLWCWKRKALTH